MIKAYNGSPEVQTMLNKKAFGRDFSSSISGYLNDSIDAYDIGFAIKNLNNPEKIKEILNTNSADELRNIAIENANETLFTTLGKMSNTEDGQTKLSYTSSPEMVVDQITNSVYSGLYNKKSLVGESLTIAAKKAGYTYENYIKLGQSDSTLTENEKQELQQMNKEIYKFIEETAIEVITNDANQAEFKKGEKLGISTDYAKKEFAQRLEKRDRFVEINKTLKSNKM